MRPDMSCEIAAEPGRRLERARLNPNDVDIANPTRGAPTDAQKIPVGPQLRAPCGAGAKERDCAGIAAQNVQVKILVRECSIQV
ncbi:MAG: hypothetical protein HUU21_37535 [Polyangiaceae bacterium]|nr:hypothetical protein [Polyangiaceae bacterium]